MTLANLPGLAGPYHDFWETHLRIGFGLPGGPFHLDLSLHDWVNDALMTLFFFVVGLEIKRELVDGELRTWQKAALPVIAAAGGMIVPASIYLALQGGRPGERGWGIPMATDIAFVVGERAVFGPRVPFGLKVFLLALAIVDDIGAILVIALAYSGSPNWIALAAAAAGFGLTYGLNRLGVRTVGIYLLVGAGIWLAVLKSGIHPTIAGVLLGLLTPASAWVGHATLRDAVADVLMRVSEDNDYEAEDADFRRLEFAARESLSPLHRLEYVLHPWVGFVIMPLFALANAGVAVRVGAVADPVAVAVAAGLILGKPVGIFGFSFLAVKCGLAALPRGVNWKMLGAAGCLGGIGFTMSLFIAGLALPDDHLDAGKVGIMIGSVLSAVLGSGLLVLGLRLSRAGPAS
jgi:NhaA family Na+:H+ antiporter